MSDNAEPLGQQIYNTLRAHRRLDALTSRMNFDDIQWFKAATREDIVAKFHDCSAYVVDLTKTGTPGELACYLAGFFDGYNFPYPNRDVSLSVPWGAQSQAPGP